MENELTTENIKTKSVKGVLVLTGRTFFLQVISFLAQLLLFAYLDISDFGIFAIVSAVVNFLTYFSDIGLAAALIQKKEEPELKDYRTTFTVQQLLVLSLVIVLFFFSKSIINFYSLDDKSLFLIYSLGLSLILTSFKSIPSVMLERKLEFTKLVLPQIIEQLIYNVTLVMFAIQGLGILSFAYAVLIRSFIGLLVIYYIQPWKIGLALSFGSLKDLFKFGVPYQLNTLLATIKDDGMTIVLGGILSPVGMGILSFSQKVARYPLTFFMDTVTKVTFPAFSRLQDNKNDLERSVTRSIFFICFLVFPSLVGLVLLVPVITEVVPRYEKWSIAIIPLLFISINHAFAAGTTQLTNLLNAIGKIKTTFYLMIMWTGLTWIIVPPLSSRYGVNGASFGYALVGASSIIAIAIAKKYVNFSISEAIIKPLFGSLVMGLMVMFARNYLPHSLNNLYLLVLIGVISYGISMVTVIGISLIDDAKKSFETIFKK
jgi:PST family polysaccharide transporter